MNQKGFANIILVLVIVVLVGAVGYFAFVKKSEPVAQQPTPTPTVTPPAKVTTTPTPSVQAGEKFEQAVNAKDYTQIQAQLNNPVTFALEGTECCGPATPAETMANFKGRIAPVYNFSQSQTKVNDMKAKKPHLQSYTIGISATGDVIGYRLNSQGKVENLFWGTYEQFMW